MIYPASENRTNIPEMQCALCDRTGYRQLLDHQGCQPMSYVLCDDDPGVHIEYCCVQHLKDLRAAHELAGCHYIHTYHMGSGEYYFRPGGQT